MAPKEGEVTETRIIMISLGPNESYQNGLVRAKRQIDKVPDNVTHISVHLNKYVDTQKE